MKPADAAPQQEQGSREAIREEALRRRAALSGKERREKSRLISEALLSGPCAGAAVIALYMALEYEVQTAPLLEILLDAGKRVHLPRILPDRKMEFAAISSMADLRSGYWNIPEPAKHLPGLGPAEFAPDLMLMPGAAFDPSGGRLGYGAGYYDRYLSASRRNFPLIGLAFERQVFPAIPVMDWDVPLDFLCTENGLRHVGAEQRKILGCV